MDQCLMGKPDSLHARKNNVHWYGKLLIKTKIRPYYYVRNLENQIVLSSCHNWKNAQNRNIRRGTAWKDAFTGRCQLSGGDLFDGKRPGMPCSPSLPPFYPGGHPEI